MSIKHPLFLLALLLFTGLGGLAPRPSHAQTITNNIVTFEQFGFTNRTLTGPFDGERYFFSMPANWRLNQGVRLELDVEVTATVRDAQGNFLIPRGQVTVALGNTPIGTIPLVNNGRQIVSFDIPLAAMTPNAEGRYTLAVNLNSGNDCLLDSEASLVVYSSSRMVLPHSLVPPVLDLSTLPRPFFQRSFEPDELNIVIPSQPTAGELQAAMTLLAGFGNLSSGRMAIQLLTADELPENPRLTKHLIFIGRPEAYTHLSEVSFAVPLSAEGFAAAGAQPTDGLLQLAHSPWNSGGVILLITGQDDNAIIMAAQAVSTGNVQVSRRRNVAVISSVRTEAFTGLVNETETSFGQLGYGQTLLEGLGRNEQTIRFFVPYGRIPVGETYLDLAYLNSATINNELSGITLRLNNNLIGSLRLTPDTTQLTTSRIPFPHAALRPGVNELQIVSNLTPWDSCTGRNEQDLWFSIRPESKLFLPLTDGSAINLQITQLRQFPDPFVYDTTLGNMALILPEEDVQAWRTAANLVFYLGDQANSPIGNLAVAYANQVPQALRRTHHFLLVGEPRPLLPLLVELEQSLPVRFERGTNDVAENELPITYRLPRNASVGYLAVGTSPWNPLRTVMLIGGRNDEGLEYAAQAFLTNALRNQLSGDFASVVDTQLMVMDSRSIISAAQVGEQLPPGSVLEGETPPPTRVTGAPDWVYPAILASVGMMGVVIFLALVQLAWGYFRRRRQLRAQ